MIEQTRVLLLATHRPDAVYSEVHEELREIKDKIQIGTYRGSFQLTPTAAVRVSDLDALLLENTPHIVHFCAHGSEVKGLTLEDDDGNTKQIGVDELLRVLTALKGDIRIVFFNVCHSRPFAEALSTLFDYAIGIDGTILDEPAMVFAGSFYRTLAFGRSVKDAFEVAKGLAQSDLPLLRVRPGVDSSEPFLLQKSVLERLKSTINRLVDGMPNEQDRLDIRAYVDDGRLILDEVEGSGITEGESQEQFEVQLHDSQLRVRLSSDAYLQVKEELFPLPTGIAPPFTPLPFVGREDAVDELKRRLRLRDEPAGHSVTVVRGWPGVGKTTLVGRTARDPDIARAYPQGVLWTALEQKPNLLSEMAAWGRALGTDEILRAPTLKEATAQLAALLRRRRMLLIVDDVWQTEHATPFLESVGENCALLITTRMTAVAEKLTASDQEIYNLPVLTEESSLRLLAILIPSIVEHHQDECRELVRDLEFLPLALHVAGGLLRSEAKLGWGVTDLIEEIREGAKLIEALAPTDRIENGTLPTVSALLKKSTDMLDESTRECFAYLAAFAPKPATFDLDAMQAVWEVEDAKPIVRVLVGHGLLEPANFGRFQMHRILVDHARSLCEE